MQVRFWGTRGSIPTPGFGTAGYGGNTSCVQVTTDAGTQVILDCGTGVRLLGDHLLEAYPDGCTGHILLTHTLWDHIQGFPFFGPAFRGGFQFTVRAPAGGERSLSEALSGQMQYTYFPVNLEELAAKIVCVDLHESEFNLGEMRVRADYVNHPGLTLAYRLECDGVSVVYSTDHEPFAMPVCDVGSGAGKPEEMLSQTDREHVEFIAGADLLIHDAQYTAKEYEGKRNWGHSPLPYTVAVALAAGVKKLVLFHHDPWHDDTFLAGMERDAAGMARRWGSSLEVVGAREGDVISLNSLCKTG